MFCSHCQKELPEDARFCSVCGRQLSENVVGHADPSDLSKTSEGAYSQQAPEPEHTLEIGPEEVVSQGLKEDSSPVEEGQDTPNKPTKETLYQGTHCLPSSPSCPIKHPSFRLFHLFPR